MPLRRACGHTGVLAATVFDGMEAASKQVVSDTCHATRDFIDHRYGAEAGAVAGDAAASVVGLTKTASNLRRVGVRPFVSSTGACPAVVVKKRRVQHAC